MEKFTNFKYKETRKIVLEEEVPSLRGALCKLEERQNDDEEQERRDTIIVSGDGVPVVEEGEPCRDVTWLGKLAKIENWKIYYKNVKDGKIRKNDKKDK